MTKHTPMPEQGQVADAVDGNWVDHRAPAWTRPYLRLSRADRPVGNWLLYIPCLWGVTLAGLSAPGTVDLFTLWIVLGCGLGAFLMRGAGCTWNDITDREFDAQVARTRSRPIPSGQVSVRGALIWMGLQGLIAFAILLTFPPIAIWLGVASLLPVAIYPFAKRFTWWPQVFLGLAFNWGAMLAWTAQTGHFDARSLIIYAAGIAWTVFYDTIYAHQDKEDDALIGVKSTARLFGTRTAPWLWAFGAGAVVLLTLAALAALPEGSGPLRIAVACAGPIAFALHMSWQLARLRIDDPDLCLALFRSNRDAGLLPVLFFAVALVV